MQYKVGAVQHRILKVLWEEGATNARRITEVLSQEKPIAHSTVQTLLRKLETKGVVTHERHERTFLFKATVPEQDVSQSAVQELLGRVFQGSVSGLFAHLLDNEEVSTQELKRLREMVDSKLEEEQK